MGTAFNLATANERAHSSYSSSKLTVKGSWNMSGPQAYSDEPGNCPLWVKTAFDSSPGIKQIAAVGEASGVLWSRMDEHAYVEPNEPVRSYRFLSEEDVRAMFQVAGIDVLGAYELVDGYYGRDSDVSWWLVKTRHGLIKLGWRKRVISINWEDTPVRAIITEDNMTKEETYVHADDKLKAIQYLTTLGQKLKELK